MKEILTAKTLEELQGNRALKDGFGLFFVDFTKEELQTKFWVYVDEDEAKKIINGESSCGIDKYGLEKLIKMR